MIMNFNFFMLVALWCGQPINTGFNNNLTIAQVNTCREELIKCREKKIMKDSAADCFKNYKLLQNR